MSETDKDILKELLVDKQRILRDSVNKAKDIIGIDSKSGEIVFKVLLTKLSAVQKIGLYLVGRYFAHGLELTKTDHASIDELSSNLGVEKNNLGWRANEMETDGIIHSAGRNKYRVAKVKVPDILDDIRLKLGL